MIICHSLLNKGSAGVIQERTAVADFIAVALCATMGREFCDCSRKDMAVAVPDCIATGLLLVIGRFWDRSGTFPHNGSCGSLAFPQPQALIWNRISLYCLEGFFAANPFYQDNERRLYLSQGQ